MLLDAGVTVQISWEHMHKNKIKASYNSFNCINFQNSLFKSISPGKVFLVQNLHWRGFKTNNKQ